MSAGSITRRAVTAGLIATPSRAFTALGQDLRVSMLEKETGARIGVAAWDSGSGMSITHRAGEHFIPCSSFKLSLAALVLQRADRGAEKLDRVIHYPPPTLGVSPATTKNQATGMTVVDLCEAAVIYSDNTAANLLLGAVGGPAGVTAFWRSMGDRWSRLDDNEPGLNEPDPVRTTASPIAMMNNLQAMLLGDVLSGASRRRLLGWMHANTTGDTTLKAGLPVDWKVGDKTGRNPKYGFVADLAIIAPPSRKPILAVCYVAKGNDAVVAAVGRRLSAAFS